MRSKCFRSGNQTGFRSISSLSPHSRAAEWSIAGRAIGASGPGAGPGGQSRAYAGRMPRISTPELLALLIDKGSWDDWDKADPRLHLIDDAYSNELRVAAGSSGVSESILTGLARISNHAVAVVVSDFDFLAGSIGNRAARRIIAAFDRATSLGLAVVGLPTSGGTRMQEGTPAFLLMAAIAAAVRRHQDAGLPYLVYLRHPTTGGVFATWGSLGDVTFAQPESLVGFLGPRVFESLYGAPFPEGVQTGEGLQLAGVIDGVAGPGPWRNVVTLLLDSWEGTPAVSAPRQGTSPGQGRSVDAARARVRREAFDPDDGVDPETGDPDPVPVPESPGRDGWADILRTREPDRPGLRQLLEFADHVVPLSGTQTGEVAQATIFAVAEFGGRGCMIVGQDRSAQESGQLIGPTDLRVARRAMGLAERWGLPLLTVVDTQGGELSPGAERGALAGEIARCLAEMSALDTPTISLLLGGGGGGAALALLPADRVLAVADAWVTPLPAEGASVIRYRTVDRADEMARTQSITALDLQEAGVVDRILPSVAGESADDRDSRMRVVADALGDELIRVEDREVDLVSRTSRWQRIESGKFN